ncbi:MAG: TolC family protein [Acidobacteriota bacterium]|nr:TolC family protein [Acidobacteriota bacterium]
MPAKLCVIAAIFIAARAEDRLFSPKELVAELIGNNPQIAAARHRVEAAAKRPSQVGTLPEPRASYTNFGVGHPFSTLNRSAFAFQGFGVSQELPFPGKLALASEEAKREAESEQQKYFALILQQTSMLKLAYYDWLDAIETMSVIEKSRDVLARFEEIARNRYVVGKGLQQDVLKAQLEVSSIEQSLEMLREKRDRAQAEIAALLAVPSISLAVPRDWAPSAMEASLEELLKAILDSPRVRAEQKLVDARATGINRSRKDFRPDFGVSLQWQHTGSNFPDYYMATAEVKIPIYYARKQRYALEESGSRLEEAKQNYQAARQQAIYEIKSQFLAIQSSERILKLYTTTLIPQASLTVDASTTAYEVGSVDFLSVLSNVTNLLTLQRQYYDELNRHEQAIARLEPAVGRELVPIGEAGK